MKKNPIIAYFRESKEELEKVSWPTRRETIRYSVATIAITLTFAVLFALLDTSLSLGLRELLNLSGATVAPQIDINPVVESIESDGGIIEVNDSETSDVTDVEVTE